MLLNERDRRGYVSLDVQTGNDHSPSTSRLPPPPILQADLFGGTDPPTSHDVPSVFSSQSTNSNYNTNNNHQSQSQIASHSQHALSGHQPYQNANHTNESHNMETVTMSGEGGRGCKRWEHIKDLDEFFSRIYSYFQRGGFNAMAVEECLFIVQIVFIMCFSTYLSQCVDYNVLFRNKLATGHNSTDKLRYHDILIPQCTAHLHLLVVVMLLLSSVLLLYYCMRACMQLVHAWEIKCFYETALNINTRQMYNMNWSHVITRLTQAQHDLQLCIQKRDLSELDICQRILRHKNYLIALTNKDLLPPLFTLPFFGQVRYLSGGLRWNLEILLFHGPWSPWHDYYTLKTEYKEREKHAELVLGLQQVILWSAILQLVLSPVIFVWNMLYLCFSTAELIKRQPNALSMRKWSNYARLYVRHFNELEHELNARLNRAHRPATQYMEQFTSSRWIEVLAQNVAFYAGAILAVLVVLSVWDEDVLQVEHALTVMTVCGLLVYGCGAFIADENLVWCPEWLMQLITAHIYYVPDAWKGHAHTEQVRHEFSQLLQYKAYYLCEELLSPFATPILMLCWLRPRTALLVDFFHKFTLNVPGLGDVCSFAQMDLVRHGDPRWNANWHTANNTTAAAADYDAQAANGKTEMSLLQFSIRNPNWPLPAPAQKFMHKLTAQTNEDLQSIREQSLIESESHAAVSDSLPMTNVNGPAGPSTQNALQQSIAALSLYHQGDLRGNLNFGSNAMSTNMQMGMGPSVMVRRGRQSIMVPPQDMDGGSNGALGGQGASIMSSLHQSGLCAPLLQSNVLDERAVLDMNVSALYLHKLHEHRVRGRQYGGVAHESRGHINEGMGPEVDLWSTSRISEGDTQGVAEGELMLRDDGEDEEEQSPINFPL